MICPNLQCGQTVVAPDDARGKVVRCAHCHTLFMVPPLATAVPAAKATEQDAPPEEGKQ
jgi:hypothetical protein